MQSLRDDVYLNTGVAVKLLFQRSAASDRKRCLASVNEIRCLTENQELLRGRTKQSLSTFGVCSSFNSGNLWHWDLMAETTHLKCPWWPRASGQGWPHCSLLQSREGLFGEHFHADLSLPVLYMSPKMQISPAKVLCLLHLHVWEKDNLFKFMIANGLI